LYVALQEARSRGLPVSPKILTGKQTRWPVDSNGYLIKNDGKHYNPTEAQAKFLASQSYFSSFHGSRGCGKSSGGAQKALQKIMQGQNGIVINPDFENLKISTWPEFKEWVPWEMVVPGQRYRRELEFDPHQPFTLAFTNGVRVIIKGVKDPDSARGPNVNWLWYDEAQRDPDGTAWKYAVASVRVGDNPQAWATWTPNGYDHWTYELFIEKKIPADVAKILTEIGYEGELIDDFFGSMLDNKSNLDPAFMAAMMTTYTIEWERQQEIFGQFVKKAGALGNRAWFDGKVIDKLPDVAIETRVRYWDLAATEKKLIGPAQKKVNDPDESVGTLMSYAKDGGEENQNFLDPKHNYEFYIENQVGGCWEYNNLLDNIYQTAIKDGPFVKIILEEEPGSGGKNQVVAIKNFLINEKKLIGWTIEGWKPEGDRVSLANYWFSECKPPENDDQLSVCGLIYLLKGDWVEPFLRQLSSFGVGKHDDKITSISGARLNLAPIRKWSKIGFLHL
jgi:phage terminase large subunit-like protein